MLGVWVFRLRTWGVLSRAGPSARPFAALVLFCLILWGSLTFLGLGIQFSLRLETSVEAPKLPEVSRKADKRLGVMAEKREQSIVIAQN